MTDAAFEIRPKLYVLAIGVSNYADPKLKLNFAAKDARDFASAWERQQGTLYREAEHRPRFSGGAQTLREVRPEILKTQK